MCKHALQCGYVVGEGIDQSWDVSIVALTLCISLCGAFTSLTICTHLRTCKTRCWYWTFMVCAGFSVGVSTVWAMHYVGMSALHLDGGQSSGASGEIPVRFELSFTIISAFAAWLIATVGLHIVNGRDVSKRSLIDRELWIRVAAAASLIASGVMIMHYMGMISQTGPFHTEYHAGVVFASGLIALVAAGVGLLLLSTMPPVMATRLVSAFLISAAVNGMHYTGMQAASYTVAEDDISMIFSITISMNETIIGILVLVADLALYAVCDSYGMQMRQEYEMAARKDLTLQRIVTAAVMSTKELGAAMNCIPATSFMSLEIDCIRERHEGYRKSGHLMILDTLEDVWEAKAAGMFIIFFSYECLAYKQAGPNKLQLRVMKASVQQLASLHGKRMEDMFVWLDCISIPQRNKAMQTASINSIYSFASLPDAMVIVCPESIHLDTQQKADQDSIRDRLWCRVEHLAYCCSRGTSSMYLHCGDVLGPLPDDWMKSVCCVFEAHSTCCRLKHTTTMTCDRKVIVQPLVALYFDVLLRNARGDHDEKDVYAYTLIKENKEKMFPRTYTHESEEGTSERDLFGDLLERAELLVDESMRERGKGNAFQKADVTKHFSVSEHVGIFGEHELSCMHEDVVPPSMTRCQSSAALSTQDI